MKPRWKGKGLEAKALADPMSDIVAQLQSSLVQSNAHGRLSGCGVVLSASEEQSDLLSRTCFGRPIKTVDNEKHWFQLSMEEAYYLCYSLKCLKIVGESLDIQDHEDVWKYMKSRRVDFPSFYKAYSHLRDKNWVVRSGSQYGVDFVAYRHHPALVHSDYAVLVLSDENNINGRLRSWSDLHCTIRLCGSVAKTLLVLNINKYGHDELSPSCLDKYIVSERVINRWIPEQCREDDKIVHNQTNKQ